MYIYRRRSKIKQQLARNKARIANRRECPSCGGDLEFAESTGDRDTFVCKECSATTSFGKTIEQIQKKTKDKTMNLITLRERPAKRERQEAIAQPVDESPVLDAVRKAMDQTSVLAFEYISKDAAKPSSRSVEPYKLTINAAGEMILYGYDLEAGSIRIFKLRGMKGVSHTEYTYKPRWDIIDKTRKVDESEARKR